ncbi:MAG: hypothetical protein JAZ19_16670 [Candidatus Thiodiazotropha taylori]|nr:hypothetical protein [Candidatus Thiodiazotropha taylori]
MKREKKARGLLFLILTSIALALSACSDGGGSDPDAEITSNCVIGSATIGDCKL